MIKIAMLLASNGHQIGGMEKQVSLQANALAQQHGFEVVVIAHPDYAGLFGPECSFQPLNTSRSRNNPVLCFQLVRQLRLCKADIIHAHGHKAAALLHRMSALTGNAKRVTSVHGTKKNKRILTSMHQVFTVSDGVRRAILPIESQILGNAVPAYNGPFVSKQALCEQYDLDAKKPLVIATGRLARVKRYDWLMRAFEPLNANLLVFGDGPESAKLRVLERKHVKLAGFLQPVQQVFQAADLMVISSNREGFSLSMIEALQCKLPIVSTPVSGAVDWLPELCLLKSRDDKQLSSELQEKLSALPDIRKTLTPVFEKVTRDCTIDKLVSQLVEHYRKLHAP